VCYYLAREHYRETQPAKVGGIQHSGNKKLQNEPDFPRNKKLQNEPDSTGTIAGG
jgi:hypothetical protein